MKDNSEIEVEVVDDNERGDTPPRKEEYPLEPLPEKSKNGRLIGPRYEAYQILRQAGMTQSRAATALGMCRASGVKMERAISKKYDLRTPKFVKLASKALQKLVKAEPFGSIEKVKDSTVMAAISEIYSRAQPVKGVNMEEKEEFHFIKINLNAFNDRTQSYFLNEEDEIEWRRRAGKPPLEIEGKDVTFIGKKKEEDMANTLSIESKTDEKDA